MDTLNGFNYLFVEPNSLFFTELEQILNYAKCVKANHESYTFEEFIIGIENTIKRGYKLEGIKLKNVPLSEE